MSASIRANRIKVTSWDKGEKGSAPKKGNGGKRSPAVGEEDVREDDTKVTFQTFLSPPRTRKEDKPH